MGGSSPQVICPQFLASQLRRGFPNSTCEEEIWQQQ